MRPTATAPPSLESALDQGGQRVHRLDGIRALGSDDEMATLLRGQHEHAHDALPVHREHVLGQADLRLEAARELDELGRGPGVETQTVPDLHFPLRDGGLAHVSSPPGAETRTPRQTPPRRSGAGGGAPTSAATLPRGAPPQNKPKRPPRGASAERSDRARPTALSRTRRRGRGPRPWRCVPSMPGDRGDGSLPPLRSPARAPRWPPTREAPGLRRCTPRRSREPPPGEGRRAGRPKGHRRGRAASTHPRRTRPPGSRAVPLKASLNRRTRSASAPSDSTLTRAPMARAARYGCELNGAASRAIRSEDSCPGPLGRSGSRAHPSPAPRSVR